MRDFRAIAAALFAVAGLVLVIAGWSIGLALHIPSPHYATSMVTWGFVLMVWCNAVRPS